MGNGIGVSAKGGWRTALYSREATAEALGLPHNDGKPWHVVESYHGDSRAVVAVCTLESDSERIARLPALEAENDELRSKLEQTRAERDRLNDRLCWIRATPTDVLEALRTLTRAAALYARAGGGEVAREIVEARDRLDGALRVALDDLDEARRGENERT